MVPPYEIVKARAKEAYQKIGKIWCPALNDHVVFNAAGFHHLIHSRKGVKSNQEQLYRFSLLSFSVDIIKNRDTIVKPGRASSKIRQGKEVLSWALNNEMAHKNITVVIRQIGNGQKHFFSNY